MAEVDDIVQNIVLTGNEEVAQAFESIRAAGERAFLGIDQALAGATSGFGALLAAVGGLAASLTIIGVGAFAFEKSMSESVDSLGDLADQTGTTTEEISGLRAAFAAGGVGSTELEQAFKRLSVSIQQSWTEIKSASQESADKLRGDLLSVESATIALNDAQKKLGDISKDQDTQQKANANSVAEARLRLAELSGQDVSSQRQALQISQARLALENARKKQADDIANAEDEQRKAAIAAEQAQLALNQARRKEEVDRKNDINNIIDAVKRTAAGDADALKTINASADNIAKGIIGASAEASQALGELRGDISDLSSPGPGVKETFLEIGKVLANIEDPALKTAVAFRLLGRSVSQDFLNVLSDPEEMERFQKRVEDLGLAVNDVDSAVADKFRKSIFTLQNDIALIAIKISTALGPALTTAVQAIDDAITRNKDSITQWAQIIGGQASSVIQSFVRVLSGVPDAAEDQWLVDYTSKISDFGSALGSLIGLVSSVVSAIVSGADKMADALNSVFGTNLNGFDIIFAALIAKLVSGFAQFGTAALSAAAGVEVAMAPVLAVLGLVAAAVYTVVKAWEALSDAFSLQGQSSQLDAMLEGMHKRLSAIAEFMSGDFQKGIDDWKKANEEQRAAEEQLESLDKQVAEGKRRRQAELAAATTDTNKTIVNDNKSAFTKIDDDHKRSIDERIAQQKRLTDETKRNVEETKRAAEDQKKAEQTSSSRSKRNKDGSIVDENGIRTFPGESGFGGGNIPDILKQMFTENFSGTAFGQGGAIRGFQSGPGELIRVKPAEPEKITEKTSDSADTIQSAAETMKAAADTFQSAVSSTTGGAGPERLTSGLGPTQIPTGGIESQPSSAFPPPVPQEPLSPELDPFRQYNDLGNMLTSIFDSIGAKLQGLVDGITNSLQNRPVEGQGLSDTTLQSLEQGIQSLNNAISNLASQGSSGNTDNGASDVPVQDLSELGSSASGASGELSSLEGAASSLASALQNAAAAANQAAGSGGGAVIEAATGGHIRGPGSETSDSIPALLSDNEYVHRAAAVRHYGVDFMHAINSLQFPRFNMGGLARLLSPRMPRMAFASGGHVRAADVPSSPSTTPPHLGTLDLRTDAGNARVMVDKPAIVQLQRLATTKRMTSTTKRKPGFVS